MQTTSTIFMIRPVKFQFNEQTAESNAFQNKGAENQNVHENALKEFDNLVHLLQQNHVEVIIIEDTPSPYTPDSIFPNNWISTHGEGNIFLYPMQAENRRYERRNEIIELLQEKYAVHGIIDLSYFETAGKFLEGTGSMVLDRENKIAYACLSPRTDCEVLNKFSEVTTYKIIPFNAVDNSGKDIYHTNVLMCVGEKFGVVCLETIQNKTERETIISSLKSTGKEIVEISSEQMNHFAGNMLQLKNKQNENLLVMSDQAFQSLSNSQIEILSKYSKILHSSLNTIESNGGGSARCMIAEIYLSKKQETLYN